MEDREDRDDEQPQIVAIKDGDLTAEQVRAEKDKNSIGKGDRKTQFEKKRGSR